MAPSRNSTRNIKSEAVIKVNGGLVTPNSSISTGTTSPKAEDAEISFSDITEANFESFQSHDGLPREQDEAYFSQVNYDQARKIRSSARKSLTLRLQHHKFLILTLISASFRSSRYSIDLTGMEELQAPGASLRIVGEKVNLLVTKVKELHELGLQELNTELPELVLVGDRKSDSPLLFLSLQVLQETEENHPLLLKYLLYSQFFPEDAMLTPKSRKRRKVYSYERNRRDPLTEW